MGQTYKVIVIGMGKRGLHHATFFKANPRFELIGISSRDSARLQGALSKLGNVPSSGEARSLALSARPDIFCFCTPPNVRLDMLKLGIECGAKLIAFEKPVALTSAELFAMRELVRKVPLARQIQDYAVRVVLATHPENPEATAMSKQFMRYGASPRGLQAIILAAKIRALLEGRYAVAIDDVHHVAAPALRHRMIMNFEGEAEGIRTDAIIAEVLHATREV